MISRFSKEKSYGLLKLSFICSESFTISYTDSYLVNFVHYFLKISLFCLEPFTICVLRHPLLFFEVFRRYFAAMHEKREDPQSLSAQNHKTLKP